MFSWAILPGPKGTIPFARAAGKFGFNVWDIGLRFTLIQIGVIAEYQFPFLELPPEHRHER